MASAVHGPRLVLLGRQGAGKGTQAAKLVVHLGVQHLSTGAILRQEVAAGTDLGLHVQELMEAGDLVPDEIVLEVVAHRLGDPEVQRLGFLLDGFPRTEPQASGLLDLLGRAGLDAAINLEVPAAVVRRRLTARRVCTRCETPTVARNREHTVYCQACGGTAVRRPDDQPDAIERRLAAYEEQVGPLLGFFRQRNLLLEIDSVGTPDDVFDALLRSLRPVLWGEGEAVG
ncbi:MAG TPA: nucleoside monophosphate kinase [Acidimicrobiales bacterium]